ncbi:SDR family oxidoreductase [Falsiroseomonas selenitidurans]|uniref:SDR family oxidoreductase n=1 Tax=Falsiroseomonas selenitidurans TaxID=2716335 RepID=A0ABX1E631_9PROT|nr:SDR family oxidoreductase [Falsiroseomonas selenitidurans]NKC32448.1 SDR family oxidoreductase [Falsiroseomonas selenitidurans]
MVDRPVMMVTGAGRGIGAATARLAAARGHDLLLTWRGAQAAAAATAEACRASGAAVELVQADAGDPAATAAAFGRLDARFGRIDALVVNAGITGPASDFLTSSDATWAEVFRVNVLGLASACRQAAQRMATSRGGAGGGIVAVSSRAAQIGSAFEFVHYAASKGAVDSLVLGLARELGGEGIRVNAVAPGMIDTDIHASAGIPERIGRIVPGIPLRRMGSPEEVAECILFLLSPQAAYVNGAVLPVGGGR